jgi:hypothetical protein
MKIEDAETNGSRFFMHISKKSALWLEGLIVLDMGDGTSLEVHPISRDFFLALHERWLEAAFENHGRCALD